MNAPLTVHLVYPDGPILTAACGQGLGDGTNTGHYASSFADPNLRDRLCEACKNLLETP